MLQAVADHWSQLSDQVRMGAWAVKTTRSRFLHICQGGYFDVHVQRHVAEHTVSVVLHLRLFVLLISLCRLVCTGPPMLSTSLRRVVKTDDAGESCKITTGRSRVRGK